MSDEILFAQDTQDEKHTFQGTWKVLIVDDEPEIHVVTKLALSDFVFQNKCLEFVSAYSGEQAKEIFNTHADIAIVLLDVVMETDDAGLKVADFIRNEANNHYTRIILRTGQPGQAPERDVIINYDINEYTAKTELTAQKLFSVMISALRSYRDINVINENRIGLEKIISSSANLFAIHSFEKFIGGIVQQLSSLLGGNKDAAYLTCAVAGPQPLEQQNTADLFVLTGSGEYKHHEGLELDKVISEPQRASCHKAWREKSLIYEDEYLVAYCESKTGCGSLLYLSGLPKRLTSSQKRLVEIFAKNVQIAFDNVMLTKDIEDTQREIIERLGQAMDHDFDGGMHIKRLVKITELIGRQAGLDDKQIQTLALAVPLHDIGKIKVPGATANEDVIGEPDSGNGQDQQGECGYNILKDSKRPLIKSAALLARDFNEHFNGSGYPRGLAGEQINIYSRITALADKYDVLRSKTKHKSAWPQIKVINTISQLSGEQFDPALVDILMKNLDTLEQITQDHPCI
jgi:response regulator RpfG family c-di-GMP phosphodiesterase